jgi:hypothetical protein
MSASGSLVEGLQSISSYKLELFGGPPYKKRSTHGCLNWNKSDYLTSVFDIDILIYFIKDVLPKLTYTNSETVGSANRAPGIHTATRRVARLVLRHIWRHWQRIVHFQKPLEPNLGQYRADPTLLYKVWCHLICIKVLEPHGAALGSTPEVSGSERFSVNDVRYDVNRAEPRAV